MPNPQQKNKQYEELGRLLVTVYETGYRDQKTMLKMSFVKGVAAGFGGVLGATALFALLLWILALFDSVPLVGPFVESFENTVQSP